MAAFRTIRNVCCVDPDCLRDTDFSTVRILLLMHDVDDVLDRLLLRNFDTGLAAVVRLRVVDFWTHPEGAPPPTTHVFHGPGNDDFPDGVGDTPPHGMGSPSGPFSTPRLSSWGSLVATHRLFGIFGGRQRTANCLGPLLYPSVPF